MRYAYFTLSALLFVSCADEGGPFDGFPGEPLPLRAFDSEPGCWTPPPQLEVPDTSEAFNQLLSAQKQMTEFRLAYANQLVQLLTKPMLEDPRAGSWKLELEGGTRIEGIATARGEDWGVLKMVAVFKDHNGEPSSLDATIEVTPARTTYNFGGGIELEQRDHLFRYGELERGCDAGNGMSFEVGTPVLVGEELVLDGRRCWGGAFSSTFNFCEGVDAETCAAEFQASFNLQCLQVIEKAHLW